MKKLMTAFAVCMIAGLVSATGVESQNIVGYSTINLPVGFSFVTAPFVPVGGDGSVYKLGSIQPNANWDGANSDTIQLIDETGSTVLTAWYFAGYGWFNLDDNSAMDDYEIPSGTCAFLEATQPDAAFIVAGQVAQTPLVMPLPVGFTLVGNSVPRQITMGDIVPNANWDGANSDTIQFIDETGSTVLTAWYFAGYGWFNLDDNSDLTAQVVAPGAGFFLEATQADAALTFPAAI